MISQQTALRLKEHFENLYHAYHHRKYVSPDPLQFVYEYDNPKDQEIAAFISSCLAYGRVQQIINSLSSIFSIMGSPYEYLMNTNVFLNQNDFKKFKHRFTTGTELVYLFHGLRGTFQSYGSLQSLFLSDLRKKESGVREILILGLEQFRDIAYQGKDIHRYNSLLSDPQKGSACKRLFMFLRWMVRKDNVDIGLWNKLSPSQLIMPLDTHIFRLSRQFGFTQRKQADLKTAIEVTNSFKKICKFDPVRYDFVLSRFGIRKDFSSKELFIEE